MALVQCRECGNEVSTEAIACPKCGAPPTLWEEPIDADMALEESLPVQRSPFSPRLLIGIVVIAVMGAGVYMTSRHKAPTPQYDDHPLVLKPHKATPDASATDAKLSTYDESAASSAAAAPITAEPAAPKADHYYSLSQKGEYAYQDEVTDDDRAAGTLAKPLIIFRYLGQRNGVYMVESKEGKGGFLATCKAPCDVAEDKTYFGKSIIRSKTIKLAPGSIIWSVFQDAQKGLLTPYPGEAELLKAIASPPVVKGKAKATQKSVPVESDKSDASDSDNTSNAETDTDNSNK